MICTFPSKKYNIEDFKGIKKHLLKFGKEKLEQTGKVYNINSEKIKARKKTNNKWFETQDSIAYSDYFLKQKIVYSEIVQSPRFYLDNKNFFVEASAFFLSGENLEYLIKALNSKIFTFAFKTYYAGGCLGKNGYRYKKEFFNNLPIPKAQAKNNALINMNNDDEIEKYFKEKINLTNSEYKHILNNTIF